MMPANPSSSRKGSSAAQKLDLFGSFLDSPGTVTDVTMTILKAAASTATGVFYDDLIRQVVRKAGPSILEFLTAIKALQEAELVKRVPMDESGKSLVQVTLAGKAALGDPDSHSL